MVEYREGLPERPARIKALSLDERGYPIPFFVGYVDGKPDFRVIGRGKISECWNRRKCWICGEKLGRYTAFTIGPMCAVNRVTSEPAAHRECAIYAATACPFLTMPTAKRRDANLPEEAQEGAGIPLDRNPGGVVVWINDTAAMHCARPMKVSNGTLFRLGEPVELIWFTHGRRATEEEAQAMLDAGCPVVRSVAEREGPEALADFERQVSDAQQRIRKFSRWEEAA